MRHAPDFGLARLENPRARIRTSEAEPTQHLCDLAQHVGGRLTQSALNLAQVPGLLTPDRSAATASERAPILTLRPDTALPMSGIGGAWPGRTLAAQLYSSDDVAAL